MRRRVLTPQRAHSARMRASTKAVIAEAVISRLLNRNLL